MQCQMGQNPLIIIDTLGGGGGGGGGTHYILGNG